MTKLKNTYGRMNRTLLCGKVVPVVVSLRKTFLSPSVVAITIANKYRVTYEILSFNYAIIHAISPMIYIFFYIPRIFLEHESIFCG